MEYNLFGQDMSTNLRNMETWQKKNIFFTEQLPVAASITIDESRRAFEQEEDEILERDVKENSNLAQKQEQVEVSSIASVVKTSTFSCCSGKSRL